ncbi:hypothetical protein MFUM_980015 [Methylacidiphilum fumariolicum SolV]|uniref:Uncharacterized protein n=2 Tax=Candidatus Methylacidiphilum fumarolicum TaxID=591154 RepID=I0K1H8_METFB|nr:conserved protein of unknown function [Candidatus Methylacidiphilum fumarolicum]CCG93347.1 hypothetical protein MFUM_980015 [Methylacidiphilum fumariolicum SolV]
MTIYVSEGSELILILVSPGQNGWFIYHPDRNRLDYRAVSGIGRQMERGMQASFLDQGHGASSCLSADYWHGPKHATVYTG